MDAIASRLSKWFGAGRPDRTEVTYEPLAPFAERVRYWRALNADPRRRDIFDRAVERVDREELERLQAKYRDEVEAHDERHFTKYLDLAPWFSYHSRLAALLDIDRREPCSILDIGSGGGHFAAIARSYGHDVTAFDRSEPEIYGDLLDLLDIERIEGAVRLGKPLDERLGRYDLIVINGQVFDIFPRTQDRWGVAEWARFIEYLCETHLDVPGELFIGLNKSVGERGARDYLWPLVNLAAAHGAAVEKDRATMRFRLTEPPRFEEIDHPRWLEIDPRQPPSP